MPRPAAPRMRGPPARCLTTAMPTSPPSPDSAIDPVPAWHLGKSIVLVGLMGAGKSSIGRRLAQRLDLPFLDADKEIEAAAGCTIEEIFERFGEAAFRDGERRVILPLLDRSPHVLATRRGAVIDPLIPAPPRARGGSVC